MLRHNGDHHSGLDANPADPHMDCALWNLFHPRYLYVIYPINRLSQRWPNTNLLLTRQFLNKYQPENRQILQCVRQSPVLLSSIRDRAERVVDQYHS